MIQQNYILDYRGFTLFEPSDIVEVTVSRSIDYPAVPLETGQEMLDSAVLKNRMVTVNVKFNYDTHSQYYELAIQSKPFTVVTWNNVHSNLYALNLDEFNSSRMYGEFFIQLKFIQQLILTSFSGNSTGKMSGTANQPVVQVGGVSANNA